MVPHTDSLIKTPAFSDSGKWHLPALPASASPRRMIVPTSSSASNETESDPFEPFLDPASDLRSG